MPDDDGVRDLRPRDQKEKPRTSTCQSRERQREREMGLDIILRESWIFGLGGCVE